MSSEESFTREHGDMLARHVTPARGRPYVHRCSLINFREVLWRIEALDTFTTADLWGLELPSSAASAALAFLKERGIVETTYRRRCVAASRCLFEDGMTELFAMPRADTY